MNCAGRPLSGGNQQKIVIARALWRKPALLVAVSPTRGLDVAATAYVHARLRERQAEGGAIVLISTELDEVIALSTRIAVLYEGRIVGIVPPDTPARDAGPDDGRAERPVAEAPMPDWLRGGLRIAAALLTAFLLTVARDLAGARRTPRRR